jgi:flagellar motor switch protein FliM
MRRVLSQEEIDAVFQSGGADSSRGAAPQAVEFDFNRLDRIPKSQLQSLHLVHENFVRNLASSLSAYLRSSVALNFVSLEQISYAEFLEGVTTPTCIAYVGLAPYEGTAVLELNNNLVFGLLELLLGSKGKSSTPVNRKITDIEKKLVQTLLRVVLRNLSEAWRSVADVAFAVQSLASEPQVIHVLAPSEAVIVIAVEVRVAGTAGLMNLAIPSIFVKRLRQKLDQLQKIRRAVSTTPDQEHVANLIQPVKLDFEAHIAGGPIQAQTLVDLKPGEILILDHSLEREVNGLLNGKVKWTGRIVVNGDRIAFVLNDTKSAAAASGGVN